MTLPLERGHLKPDSFDYGELDPDIAAEARASAERIRDHGQHQNAAIISIGKELAAVKVQLGHGHFGRWIKAEFGMSNDTAERYLRIEETFGGSNSATLRNLGFSVLDQLARPSTPDLARDEIVAEAQAGKRLTVTGVIKRIAAAKPPATKRQQCTELKLITNPLTLGPRIEAADTAFHQAEDAGIDPAPVVAKAIAGKTETKTQRRRREAFEDRHLISFEVDAGPAATATEIVEFFGADRARELAEAILIAADRQQPTLQIH